MKKIKFGASFLLLILFSILTGQLLLLVNYMLALSLHELAHMFVAINNGYTLETIKINMFGMSVNLKEKIDDKDSFKINIAGPLFNLFICVLCMAIYWLVPNSFYFLNKFCVANLTLAIFNLLPIYPLDGGKIFYGIIKNPKTYKRLDLIMRITLASIFALLFTLSLFNSANIIYLLLAFFFITSKKKYEPALTIFKYKQNKNFDKVVIIKVNETETLLNLIKQIKLHRYTIFYSPKLNKYFDEDNIISLSLKYPLNTALSNIN